MPKKYGFYALKLCILIIVIFLFQVVFKSFTDIFILNESSWSEPWRFLSSIFLHGGLGHLLLNLFALGLFGSILERFVGGFRFFSVFLLSGIFANLVSVNFYNSSLGASGAIFGILGALILLRPMMVVWAFGLPMPIFVAGILWAVGDVIGAYGFLAGNPMDNTGNIAHLSGLIVGLLFGYFLRERFRMRTKRVNVSIDEDDVRIWEDKYMRHFR